MRLRRTSAFVTGRRVVDVLRCPREGQCRRDAPRFERDRTAVDDCTPIYDLNENLAPQLADQWPTLPATVQIASGDGERLLAAAQDRAEWSDQPTSDGAQEGETVLYDERGSGIRDKEQLTRLLDDTDDEVWLVPAIALQHTTDETGSVSQEDGTSTGDPLECQQCGRETHHRFSDFESLPDETWLGQPI